METNKDRTHKDVRSLINTLVLNFLEAHPDMDEHEAWSSAGLAFCLAYESYDPAISSFNTHVGFRVTKALLTAYRNQVKRQTRSSLLGEFDEAVETPPDPDIGPFVLQEWTNTLSDDAKKVVDLALRPPKKVRAKIEALGQGDTLPNVRYAIRQFLRDLQWTAKRIADAFKEVKDNL